MSILNLYNNGGETKKIVEKSPIAKSHKFEIKIVPSSLINEEVKFNRMSITGIMDTLPAISYQTTWENSPVSVITENIKSFTDNAAIRTFAQNNGKYRVPVVTDGWTQQMPTNGSTLSVSLSFKSYPELLYDTTDYRSIINFLIFLTTPREYYLSDSAKYIGRGLEEAYSKGEKAANIVKGAYTDFQRFVEQTNDSQNTSYIKVANYVIADETDKKAMLNDLNQNEQDLAKRFDELGSFFTNLLNMSDKNAGGAPLCILTVHDLINEVSGDKPIHWLIKSWSFKPSINTTADYDIEMPIFVEFKIDLETQTVLSNSDMIALIGKGKS